MTFRNTQLRENCHAIKGIKLSFIILFSLILFSIYSTSNLSGNTHALKVIKDKISVLDTESTKIESHVADYCVIDMCFQFEIPSVKLKYKEVEVSKLVEFPCDPEKDSMCFGPKSGPAISNACNSLDPNYRYSPTEGKDRNHISPELKEAWKLPEPNTKLKDLTPAERKVLSWIQSNSNLISEFAKKWGVDERAIAGIIMWEALENHPPMILGEPSVFVNRWSGIGKFHFWERLLYESVGEQLEKRGYLPSQTGWDRREILSNINGALDYIGALLRAFTDIAERAGYDISHDPAVLGNFYNGWLLSEAERWAEKKANSGNHDCLNFGNDMGKWIHRNLPYIEDGFRK